jgi:hypothetical protein
MGMRFLPVILMGVYCYHCKVGGGIDKKQTFYEKRLFFANSYKASLSKNETTSKKSVIFFSFLASCSLIILKPIVFSKLMLDKDRK